MKFAAILTAMLLLSPAGAQNAERKRAVSDISALKLPDSVFWATGDRDPGLDPIPKQFQKSYFGILIDGPKVATIQQRETLPVFAYYMGTYRESASRDFPRSAVMVVMDPDNNRIYAGAAMRRRRERSENSPTRDLPEGYLLAFQKLDARARTRVPWTSGRVISQVVLLDLASNRIETKLEANTVAGSGSKQSVKDPPAPFPPVQLNNLDVPPIPVEMGVRLTGPKGTAPPEGKPLPLSGSWRLPVLPEELVKPDHKEINRERRLLQADGTPFAACLAIHLVVVNGTGQAPYVYTLQLPVAKVSGAVGKQAASGTFSIDLRSLPQFPESGGPLAIYAFAKEWASGPALIGAAVDGGKR